MRLCLRNITLILTVIILSACQQQPVFKHKIIGTAGISLAGNVINLQGQGLVIALNGSDALTINSNGFFNLPQSVNPGQEYTLTVTNQPTLPNQTCTITNGASGIPESNIIDISIECTNERFTVSGTVAGYTGSGLQLELNQSETILVTGTSFTFATEIDDGGRYNVQTKVNPTGPVQICSPQQNVGIMTGTNVSDVSVVCSTVPFSLGAFVSGLGSESVTLEVNGGQATTRNADGFFLFPVPLADQTAFDITVSSQPSTKTCSVNNGAGTLNGKGNYSSLIQCSTDSYSVGGSVSGLSSGFVTLVTSAGEFKSINANGSFTFDTTFADTANYQIEVFRNPVSPAQTCTVGNASGNISGGNISNVNVSCTLDGFTVGGTGTISGLSAGGLTLRLNGSEDLNVSAGAGSFVFSGSPLADLASYQVTVAQQPTGLKCVTNATASGSIAAGNVNNVVITCNPGFTVGGTISGLAGSNLILRNNGGDDFTASGNGAYTFSEVLLSSESYNVSVANQPESPYQNCSVANSSGTVSGSVSNANVSCSNISVQFQSVSSNATEANGNQNIQINVSPVNPTRDIVLNLSLGVGSASSGIDFNLVSNSITIPTGSSTANAVLQILDDSDEEANETVVLRIDSVTNANLGSNLTHTHTINNVDIDPATQVVLTDAGNDFQAGGTTSITVQIQNASGTLVSSDNTTRVTFTPTSNGAISGVTNGNNISGTGAAGAPRVVEVSGGIATVTLANTTAETFEVAFTNNAALMNPANDSISVSPGAPDRVVIVSAGSDGSAGSSTTLTVQVQDANGNLVTTDSSTQITFAPTNNGTISGVTTGSGDGGYGVAGGAETITVVNGVATINVTNNTAEIYEIAITSSPALTNPPNDSITVTPAAASQIALTTPGTDFDTLGSTSITVQVRDSLGNLITTDSSTQVTFSPSGSGRITGVTTGSNVSGTGAAGVPRVVTVAGGIATVTVENSVAEIFTIAFTNNGGFSNPGDDSITVTPAGSGAVISSAEYFDTDHNGKIDHVKITFDKSVDDSTLTGYVNSSTDVNVVGQFDVAAYGGENVVPTSCIDESNPPNGNCTDSGEGDAPGNDVIWLKFTEGANYDTGAKPDLTGTNVSLRNVAGEGSCFIFTADVDCATQSSADFGSGAVTEIDRAPAVLLSAWSDPIIDAWQLRLQFSEAVDTTLGVGCTGTVNNTAFSYTNTSGGDASALRTDSADSNGCNIEADGSYLIKPRVNARFTHSDLGSDTITPQATLYDAANNAALQSAKTITYDPQLELYYPMDSGLGDTNSVVTDVSGNGRNGVTEGDASLTNDMTGESSQAYVLDGDDNLRASTYIGEVGDQARTFALWVKAETTGQIIFSGELGATSGAKFFFRINGNGSNGNLGSLTIDVQGGRLTSEQRVVGTGWHHLAVAYGGGGDDITDSALYIDGRLVTSFSNSVAQAVNTLSGLGLTIGFNLRGKVDEARVYSRALTVDEIKKLATKVPGGLVAQYPLDSDASDLTGGGRDGTAAGDAGATANDRYGIANSAFTFDGTGDWVTATIPELPQGSANRTLCAWAQHLSGSSTGTSDVVLAYGSNSTDQRFDLRTPSTVWAFDTSGQQTLGGSVGTNWSHICARYDGSVKSIWVNGELRNTSTRALNTNGTIFTIGVRQDQDANNTWFGDIQDVRIYNRALTAGEIKALATELDRGLVAYYPLDDNTTSTAAGAIKDYSGKNPNLTLTAGPVPTTDRFGNSGSAYLYNGTGKMESESTPTNLPVNDANRTACAWAANNATGSNFIMEYGGTAASNHVKYRITFQNNFFQSDFRTGGTITSPVIAANNQWAHYCARFRNNNTNEIFVNGVIEGTVTGYTNAATAQDGLVIGGNLFSDRFNGSIDDVRVYDRALSLTEIRELSGFHPGQLDDVSLLLDAGRGVYNDAGSTLATNTQTVREWHDISFTNGTANGINVTQGTTSDRPTWRQTVAAVNNMPVVRFDGNNDYLSTSVTGTGVLSETEWSVFTVMMQDGSQAQNGVFSWGFDGFNRASLIATDNDSITFMGTRNADPSGKSSAPQPAGWDNNYHTLYGYLNSANDGEINVDGTMIDSWTNMTYNPDFSTNSTMSIGRDNTFAYYLEGDIAELVLFKRAPSAEERTQIVCYFHKKYGITVSTSCD